jgi:hypothetical protein
MRSLTYGAELVKDSHGLPVTCVFFHPGDMHYEDTAENIQTKIVSNVSFPC